MWLPSKCCIESLSRAPSPNTALLGEGFVYTRCEAAPWIHALQLYSTAKPTPPKNKHAKKRDREREIYKAKNRRPHPSTYPPCPTPRYPLGVEASTDGVEVQLADGNAHPPGPQVAQTQDTTTIWEDDAVAEEIAWRAGGFRRKWLAHGDIADIWQHENVTPGSLWVHDCLNHICNQQRCSCMVWSNNWYSLQQKKISFGGIPNSRNVLFFARWNLLRNPLNLTWLCTKASWNLLRNLLRNPVEPDLPAPKSPRPSPEPSSESCWTWPASAPKPPGTFSGTFSGTTWPVFAPKPPRPSPEPGWT